MAGKSKKTHELSRTRNNKIRRLEKELTKNPSNLSAQKALEFWRTHDRKVKHRKRKQSL